MISYLPELYPDELVYSWFCRLYIHGGYLTHKAALTDLFEKRSCNPSKEFIGYLNAEAKSVISKAISKSISSVIKLNGTFLLEAEIANNRCTGIAS